MPPYVSHLSHCWRRSIMRSTESDRPMLLSTSSALRCADCLSQMQICCYKTAGAPGPNIKLVRKLLPEACTLKTHS